MTRDCESCGRSMDGDGIVFGSRYWFLCAVCRENIVEWVESDATPGVSCEECGGPVDMTVRPGGPTTGPTLRFECHSCEWNRTAQYVGET